MIVGFDLDGVLVNDSFVESDEDVNVLLKARQKYRPLFIPPVPFVIVTGRPGIDESLTREWAKSVFEGYSTFMGLHHNRQDMRNAATFKAQVIQDLQLDVFVESDSRQIEQIRKLLKIDDKCTIIHFRSFIERCLCEEILGIRKG